MHEALQDVEQAVGLQHLVPQVMRLPVTVDGRIARAVAVPPVEREEDGLLALEPCGHPDLVRVHGEVDERALPEREDQVAPVALVLVLRDGVSRAHAPRAGDLRAGAGGAGAVNGNGPGPAIRELHDRSRSGGGFRPKDQDVLAGRRNRVVPRLSVQVGPGGKPPEGGVGKPDPHGYGE